MFLDSFNVILDAISDYVNKDMLQAIVATSYPIMVVLLLTGVIIFAWRSTEVSTDDEVQGQFTIPGRGTFNVINPGGRSSSRGQSETPPTEGASNSTTEEQEDEEEEFDAGDEEETEISINVRYLDESVKSCQFRPSQSLGHFKQTNWTDVTERNRVF